MPKRTLGFGAGSCAAGKETARSRAARHGTVRFSRDSMARSSWGEGDTPDGLRRPGRGDKGDEQGGAARLSELPTALAGAPADPVGFIITPPISPSKKHLGA